MELGNNTNVEKKASDILSRTEVLLKNAESFLKSVQEKNSCNHIYYLNRVVSYGGSKEKDHEYVCIKCGLQFIHDEKLDVDSHPDFRLIKGRGLNISYLDSIYTTIRCSFPLMSDDEICQYMNQSIKEITDNYPRKKVNTK